MDEYIKKERIERAIVCCMLLLIAFVNRVHAEEKGGASLWPFDIAPGYLSGMSDNGKWGLFKTPDYSEIDAIPRRMNLTTGKIEELPLVATQQIGYVCKCIDITDDGEIIAGSYGDDPAYYKNGEWHVLPVPRDMRGFGGPVCSVSPDGEWMVAWLTKSFTEFRPLVWHNFELVELGELPTYEELYQRGIIDKQTLDEHKALNQTPNFAFFKISDDGKHVLSGIDHNYPGWGCSYIVYHTDTKTYDWIADDLIERGAYVSSASMSNNGKWIQASITQSRTNPDGSWDDYHTAVFYDVEQKTFTRNRGGGGVISNDGNFYSTSINNGYANVRIDKILKQKYGIDFYATTGYDALGTAFYISSDLRTMLCQPSYRDMAYSVTFPVEFKEAASDINLLEDWSVNPKSGTVMSKLSKITLTFDYTCKAETGAKAKLYCDGEETAESEEISGSGRSFRIDFSDILLEKDKKYEIRIEEGVFSDSKTGSLNNEIAIDYIGREDGPLTPVTVTPTDGSSMMELSVNSYVIIDFGADIKLIEEPYGELFEDDNVKPFSSVAIATDGTRIACYPAAARKLANGKSYRLHIPAATVTDINGENPNEPIDIVYRGTFVPTIPVSSSTQLFFEDFSNPNEALNHFLQYEGDHLTPTTEMQEWGFDNDNTPWNFSVRDDDDYDYCAASTSAYNPKGTADNWLVIPRLSIDNEYEWLTFKSQSHRYDTTDILKILIWESDEVLGSLDKQVVDRMRAEGKVVYEKRQSCGSSVDRLADDWLENEISLKDYKGKNIYIAFVDNNTAGSCLFLDDICVEYRGNYQLRIEAPSTIVGDEECRVKGKVEVLSDKVYNKFTAKLLVNGEDSGLKHTQTDIIIDRQHPYEFEFDETPALEHGKTNRLQLSVTLGDESQSVVHEVKALEFKIDRNVFVEEGTGTWCGWCPEGFIALEYLQENYPGRISEVSVHYNDGYAMDSYASFLNFGAYPAGRVDRLPYELAPMLSDPATGRLTLTSKEGNRTFVDMVEQRLNVPAEAEIKLRDAGYMENDRARVNVEVRYALSQTDLHQNILAILTEYDLMAIQSNNLAGLKDPLAGKWGEMESNAYIALPAVARQISATSYFGEPGRLPSYPQSGETYEVQLQVPVPAAVQDRDKLKLVVAIINAANGEIVNSASTDFLRLVGVENLKAKDCWMIKNRKVFFNDSDEVEVFAIDGRKVANENLQGVFIVKSGQATRKIAIP